MVVSFFRKLKSLIPIRVDKNSYYSEDDYRNAFLYSALTEGTAESTGNILTAKGYLVPSGDRQIEVIKKLPLEELEVIAENMLKTVFKEARKYGAFRFPVIIATDPCDIPYYGNPCSPFVVGTKHKQGTSWAHSFVCTDAVIKGERFTLSFNRRTMQSKDSDIVAKVLKTAKERAKISISLLDREFYSVDVVNIHKMEKLNFIIPAVDTSGVKDVKRKYDIPLTTNYIMKSGEGKQTEVKLSLVARDKETYGFINNMNMEPEDIANIYSMRWGVETGHRMRNKFRARTCSRDYNVRCFYFILSVALYSFWVLVNLFVTEQAYGFPGEPKIRWFELKAFLLVFIEGVLSCAAGETPLSYSYLQFFIFSMKIEFFVKEEVVINKERNYENPLLQ